MFVAELDAVKAFQELFEVDLSPIGTRLNQVPDETIELNRRIVDEELTETLEKGVAKLDEVEIADGCADSLYVLAHAINQLGRVPNKEREPAAKMLLRDAIGRINNVLGPRNLFIGEVDVDRNLAFAEIVVRGVAAVYNIPLDEVFAEVHRSNMTKVWPDGKVRKDAGGKIIKPEGYERPDVAGILARRGR